MRSLPTYVRDDQFTGRGNGVRPRAAGSREHYFHFLIGYLLPIVHARQRHPLDEEFTVLDCGPVMTPLLEQTLTRLNLRFVLVRPADVRVPIYVEAWDHNWKDGGVVRHAIQTVADAWRDVPCSQPDCPPPGIDALLLERSAAPDFYLSGPAEKRGYGLSRRGIVNWPEVHAHLKAKGVDHVLYEPGRHSLSCQIACFGRARRVVGIRGAEWANLVWAQPGRIRVRLLDPSPPAAMTGSLAKRLGVDCRMVKVAGINAREDAEAVARFLSEA